MSLPALSLAVVGVAHKNTDGSNRRFNILLCEPGEPIDLRPEPKNRHDRRAVAVHSVRGDQLGYLSAERCGRIGALIREGREVAAIFQAATAFGAWIRVAFDGEQPTLPPVRTDEETEAAEQDFYPDEVWPDD
ncbi:MAG: HIRAN domain-containing protein [Erythrobacter sp.]|nr:HIRAN domain-containing protein [Erythrobacter sp.]